MNNKNTITANVNNNTIEKLDKLKKISGYTKGQLIDIAIKKLKLSSLI
jgi:hypothetical protein